MILSLVNNFCHGFRVSLNFHDKSNDNLRQKVTLKPPIFGIFDEGLLFWDELPCNENEPDAH